jgi:superfamily II DNA or RNA helicase
MMTAPTLFDGIDTPSLAGLSFKPREYQSRAFQKTLELWDQGTIGVLNRLPTGTGKTVLGAMLIREWISRGPDYHVLVLSHERQLVSQFADEVRQLLGIEPGIEMAEQHVRRETMPRVVVSCRQSLLPSKKNPGVSRLNKFDPRLNWLLILDEVHRWAYQLKSCRHVLHWFESNPIHRRTGLTATPLRGDGVTLARVVPGIGSCYRLFDIDDGPCAVKDGYAVPYDQRFIIVEGIDFKNLPQVAGDFDADKFDAILVERAEMLKLVQPLLALVGDRRTIIFCPGVGSAKLVALTINAELGKNAAASLHGGVPEKIRKQVYRQHQTGAFQFLVVCGLCREGYNDPGIGAVAVFRPTKSRTLAEQMKGRGCRPLRGCIDGLTTAEERRAAIAASAKPNCMIVDLVGITGLADCNSTAHLLAEGKPDEVIERANANAMKKDGPVDMAEEVKHAERQLREEKEEQRKKREEQERKEREEAERRARIKAEARWKAQQVQQGHGGSSARSGRQARMTFGKHLGQPLTQIPTDYLEWAVENTSGWLAGAIADEIEKRPDKGLCTPAQAKVLQRNGEHGPIGREKADVLFEVLKARGWSHRSYRLTPDRWTIKPFEGGYIPVVNDPEIGKVQIQKRKYTTVDAVRGFIRKCLEESE